MHPFPSTSQNINSESAFKVIILFVGLLVVESVLFWQTEVSRRVTTPYLDEEFHVRQAQTYCSGDLLNWDPKITTPPGLYLVIWAFHKAGLACDLQKIRLLGGISLLAGIAPLVFVYRRAKRKSARTAGSLLWSRREICACLSDLHVALNVALFPPLFFFAGLFYTDVVSTTTVLAMLYLKQHFESGPRRLSIEGLSIWPQFFMLVLLRFSVYGKMISYKSALAAIMTTYVFVYLLNPQITKYTAKGATMQSTAFRTTMLLSLSGCIALTFRQTNIFWVAIFPSGLTLAEFTRSEVLQKGTVSKFVGSVGLLGQDQYHEKPVQNADASDYVQTIITLVAHSIDRLEVVLRNPASNASRRFVTRFAPYIFLVILFGGFVVWNGGVVLGDKSNHVSTIHLPQMLYIWPFMLFFSWPLVYPWILGALIPTTHLPSLFKIYATKFPLSFASLLPTLAMLLVVLGIVHFNTIIHPFTLADNRHYVFYVFRILRLNPWLFYAAAPVYIASAWAILQTLCPPKKAHSHHVAEEKLDKTESNLGVGGESTAVHKSSHSITQRDNGGGNSVPTIANDKRSRDVHEVGFLDGDHDDHDHDNTDLEPTRVSWVIVWLATCTLCLVTAPLVEPRYYILPWLLWRLEVPSIAPALASAKVNPSAIPLQANKKEDRKPDLTARLTRNSTTWLDNASRLLYDASDHRLWLETGWFVVVNVVTCYVFLYRPFESKNEWEMGELRRFMW